MNMRALRSLFVRLTRRGPGNADLDAELLAHLEMDTDARVQAGALPAEAERQARLRLGGAAATRERVADQRGLPWLEEAWQDVRYGVRMLWRYPTVSVLSVLLLAGGIAGVTAMVGFSQQMLSAAAPPVDLSRRIRVWSSAPNQREHRTVVSPEDYGALVERSQSVARWSAVRRTGFNFAGLDRLLRISAMEATPGLFEVMGVKTLLGRPFTDADVAPGAARTTVLGHGFWQRHLGGSTAVLGGVITLDGVAATIIGVTTADTSTGSDVIVPLVVGADAEGRARRSLTVSALLRPGMSVAQSGAELARIASDLGRERPETNEGWGLTVTPLGDSFVSAETRQIEAMVGGAALLVFLMACANVAGLLLTRGIERRREVAVRLAMGVSRHRLLRQFLMEGMVQALLTAAVAIGITYLNLKGLALLFGPQLPPDALASLAVDARLLASAAIAGALVCGLVPALQASRRSSRSVLEGLASRGTIGGGQQRLSRALLAGQVAVAALLAVLTTLGVRSAMNLQSLKEVGFSASGVVTGQVTLPESQYPVQAISGFYEQVQQGLAARPDVDVAAATARVPAAGSRLNPNRNIVIAGRRVDPKAPVWAIDLTVTPRYFAALRVAVPAGRDFDARDGASAPLAAMVNQAMARRHWPDGNALGARIRLGDEGDDGWRTIVGVVADVRNDDIDAPPVPHVYVPLAQRPERTMTLVVRSRPGSTVPLPALQAAVSSVDRDQPVYALRTLDDILAEDLAGSQALPGLLGAFAVGALVLAAAGTYSVIAFSVSRRKPEIALRLALGASRRAVAWLVTRQGLVPVLAGVLFGLAGALGLAQVGGSFLYGVTPGDPVSYVAAACVLGGAGVLAAMGPALRAMRVAPLQSLREG